jgi:hypothetical protein
MVISKPRSFLPWVGGDEDAARVEARLDRI